MREIFGDALSYVGRNGFVICITTNGFLKTNGEGVMGAGIARQVSEQFPELPKLLGQSIAVRGNVVSLLTPQFLAFPVKHLWMQDADLDLIRESAEELKRRATNSDLRYILPRPGCGNGKLSWPKQVKPLLESLNLPDNIWIIAPWREAEK